MSAVVEMNKNTFTLPYMSLFILKRLNKIIAPCFMCIEINFYNHKKNGIYIENSAPNFQNNVILSVSEVSKQKDSSGYSPQNDELLIVSVEFAI